MESIKVTIGEKIENFFYWEKGFPNIITKYIGGETENGICYKDLSAWERGGYDDIIYISDYDLKEPIHNNYGRWTKPSLLAFIRTKCEELDLLIDENFIEEIAFSLLKKSNGECLSKELNKIDLIDEFNIFISRY